MNLCNELEDCFGRENLVCAYPESLHDIKLPDKTKDFILNTGLPNLACYFRFSMEFEPLSSDIQIGESAQKLGRLFTIGCKGATQLIGRCIHLKEIGLNNNASLTDIGRQIKLLNLDSAVFHAEVMLAPRICLDLENDGQIKYVNPTNLSTSFLNSSIEQLAASLIAYKESFSLEEDFILSLEKLKNELHNIDSRALKNQDNVWSVVIEQLILDEEGY
jgi:hypothetical protein